MTYSIVMPIPKKILKSCSQRTGIKFKEYKIGQGTDLSLANNGESFPH